MRYITQRIFFVIVPMIILFAGCKGKEGDPGPTGPDGNTGIGFDDLAKYGSITLYLSGTTAWGDPFKDTLFCKFAEPNLSVNEATVYEPNDIRFDTKRYSGFGDPGNDTNVQFYIETVTSGTDTTFYLDTYLNANVYLEDTHKSFRLSQSWDNYYDEEMIDNTIEGFKYDPSTGKLYYRLDFTIDEFHNYTSHDLHIKAVVDATVFQYDND